MKILSGNEQRDSGVIFIDGQEIDIRTPGMPANMASPLSTRS
jgi:ABC-type sugar transport system ATPase subunit